VGGARTQQVICDKGSGESKGYGFVKFYRMADAMNAIAYMNGYPLGSKHLKVTFKTATMRM
jgi:RNA recognition motif-containing protein